ncbi:MAG: hypothetical protein JSS75_02085 [Bacteroidetes bacterium]|nr:hypothetical protein [Bacteroidota bacterium]
MLKFRCIRLAASLAIILLWSPRLLRAQMPTWQHIRIPADSVIPFAMEFADSLHGYLGVVQPVGLITAHNVYFVTSDGGRSWQRVNDTLLSPANEDLIYFPFPTPAIFLPTLGTRYLISTQLRDDGIQHNGIVHSEDSGKTWTRMNSNVDLIPLHVFRERNVLAYDRRSGRLYWSTDAATTFAALPPNPVFDSAIWPLPSRRTSTRGPQCLSFDVSDQFHWTAAIDELDDDSTIDAPLGFTTLLSSDFGATWRRYTTPIDGETINERFHGTLTCIPNTPHVYYFSGHDGEGKSLSEQRSSVWADAQYGINWLYSTDYGASWAPQHAYGTTRLGFEAVADSLVWITAKRPYLVQGGESHHVIARTLDNGNTWDEDSTTLRIETEYLDGRIVTFSGPRHGWIAAVLSPGNNPQTYVFRYDEADQLRGVESVHDDYLHILLKTYPNPCSNVLHLQLLERRSFTSIEIYDAMARRVMESRSVSGRTVDLPVRQLSPGLYFARAKFLYDDDPEEATVSFIVER